MSLSQPSPSEQPVAPQSRSHPMLRGLLLIFGIALSISLAIGGGIILYFTTHSPDPTQSPSNQIVESQIAAPVVASLPPAPPPILTKDTDFIKLIHPVQSEDDLLAHSAEFAQKKQEIEAQLNGAS
jgi:hypothetical protein